MNQRHPAGSKETKSSRTAVIDRKGRGRHKGGSTPGSVPHYSPDKGSERCAAEIAINDSKERGRRKGGSSAPGALSPNVPQTKTQSRVPPEAGAHISQPKVQLF